TRPVHDLPGEDEERHRHEGEEIEPLEKTPRRHRQEIGAADLHQPENACDPENVADRQAKEHQAEECEGDDRHGCWPATALKGASRTMVAAICSTVRPAATGT